MTAAKKTATKTPKIKFSSLKAGDKINVNIKYSGKSHSHEATVVLTASGQTHLFLDKNIDRADFSTCYFYGAAYDAVKKMGLKATNKRAVTVWGDPAHVEITGKVKVPMGPTSMSSSKHTKSMMDVMEDELAEDYWDLDDEGGDEEDLPTPKRSIKTGKKVPAPAKKAVVKKQAKKKALGFCDLKVGDRVHMEIDNAGTPRQITAIVIDNDFDVVLYADSEIDYSKSGGPKTTVVDDIHARTAYEYGLNMSAKRQLTVRDDLIEKGPFRLISKLDPRIKWKKEIPFKDCKVGDKVSFTVFENKGKETKHTGTVIESGNDAVKIYSDKKIKGNNSEVYESEFFDDYDYDYDTILDLGLDPRLDRKWIIGSFEPGGTVSYLDSRTAGTPPKKREKIKFGDFKKGDKVEIVIRDDYKDTKVTGTVLISTKSYASLYLDKKFDGVDSYSDTFDYDEELADVCKELKLNPKLNRLWFTNNDAKTLSMQKIDPKTKESKPVLKQGRLDPNLVSEKKDTDKISRSDLNIGDEVALDITYKGEVHRHMGTVLYSHNGEVDFYLDGALESTIRIPGAIRTGYFKESGNVSTIPTAKALGFKTNLKRLFQTWEGDALVNIVSVNGKTNILKSEPEKDIAKVDAKYPAKWIDLGIDSDIKTDELTNWLNGKVEMFPLKLDDLKIGDRVNLLIGDKKYVGVYVTAGRFYLDGEYDDHAGNRTHNTVDGAYYDDAAISLMNVLGLDKTKKHLWSTYDGDDLTVITSKIEPAHKEVNENNMFVKSFDLNDLWQAYAADKKITYEHVKPGDKVLLSIHDSKTGQDAKVKAYVTRSTPESIDFLFEKEFSNTTLASWSIKKHQLEQAASFGFDANKKVGWHINADTKYTSIEKILPKDDPSFSSKPEDESVKLDSLKEGDYIEFEINFNGVKHIESGYVVCSTTSGIDIYPDRAFNYGWDGSTYGGISSQNRKVAQGLGLGFPIADLQYTILNQNKIAKVTKVKKPMTDKISYAKLKKGDKVSVEFEDKGTITKRAATVLGLDGKSAILYLDGGPLTTSRGPLGQSWNPHDAGFEKAAEDLGLDSSKKCCWRYKDTSVYTKVTAINTPNISLDSLKPGDMIEFELSRNGMTEQHKAKVIGAEGAQKLIAFDEPYAGICGNSWAANSAVSGYKSQVKSAADEFSIDKDSKVLFRAYDHEFFVKKVTKPAPILSSYVKPGDKIQATIYGTKTSVDATAFYIDGSNVYIYLDDKDLSKVPAAWTPISNLNGTVLDAVVQLGLDKNAKKAFRITGSYGDTIDRIVSKSTALLPTSLRVGDRLLIEIAGVQEQATVVQAKAPFKSIVIAFDNPIVVDGKPISGPLVPSYSNIAKSYGHTTDFVHGMNLDSRHKIVKRITSPPVSKPATKTETEKPIEKKETKMTAQVNFMDRMKEDMESAGYRVASTQFTNAIKQGILLVFKDKGFDDTKLSVVKEILESEFGTALVATVLGYGLTYVPNLKDDPRIKRLAGEFRISGMATVGNEIMGIATSYFLPAVTSAMAMLPPVETAVPATMVKKTPAKAKRRIVAAPVEVPVVEETHSEELKQATA